jgi:hypothetical protein
MTTLPTIHLNGTGAKSLFDEYHEALRFAHRLRTAIAEATCNQRDFYPQGEEAWQKARAERMEAFAKLSDVEEYLTAWAEHAANHLP